MNSKPMTFYTLDPPVLWRAGFTGSGADAKPFYFSCGLCGKQGEIAGFIGSGPTIHDVATLENPDGSPFRRLALFCKPCLRSKMGGGNQSTPMLTITNLECLRP